MALRGAFDDLLRDGLKIQEAAIVAVCEQCDTLCTQNGFSAALLTLTYDMS